MAKVKHQSAKPSGLTITRNGNVYKCAWKQGGENYKAGQKLEYSKNGGKWTAASIGVTAVSYSLTDASLKSLKFRVMGCKGKYKKNGKTITPKWSEWATSTEWAATVPKKPTLTYSSVSTNSGLFKWDVKTAKDDKAIFDNVIIQKQLRRDNVNNPTTGTWTAVSGSAASGSFTLKEEPNELAAGPFIRWVRIKSRGNAGDSAWTYAYHAYGAPAAANLISAKADTVNNHTSRITATWSAAQSKKQPIDKVTIQYAIEKPTDWSMSAPSSGWQDAIELTDGANNDKIVVNVSDAIGLDECMWVRIMTEHDEIPAYSKALLAQKGALTKPTINASPNFSTGQVTITITEETACTVANTAIFYRASNDAKNDRIIGVMPRGTTSATYTVRDLIGKSSSCFGAYAFVGLYSGLKISANMTSAKAIDNDIAAVAPRNVTVSDSPRDDTVRIGWEWTWTDALSAELSWADHEDAWTATDEPNTYKVEDRNAVNWVIAGIESGKRWFFRVRLIGEQDGDELIGPWSDVVTYDMGTVPDKPVLTLNKSVINVGDTFTARWAYAVGKNTEQAFAEIDYVITEWEYPAVEDSPAQETLVTRYVPLARVTDGQSVDITHRWDRTGFPLGETYDIVVRIATTDNTQSEWSDPVPLTVAEPVEIVISASNIAAPRSYMVNWDENVSTYVDGEQTDSEGRGRNEIRYPSSGLTPELYDELYTNDDSETVTIQTRENTTVITTTRQYISNIAPEDYMPTLTAMPFSITITGAGAAGTTILAIVRAEDYHVDRPDETEYDGFEGETIYSTSQIGEDAITVNVDDLVGSLDNGARYKIIATVIDEYGQTASREMPFVVNWSHPAGIPSATVVTDKYQRISKITPKAPATVVIGDTCDIYRLTADQPELIVKGASFGTTYVDPYPAFGEMCGHRIVTRSVNGDYATSDGHLAWYDTDLDDGDLLEEQQMIIDVDGVQIELPYNITLQNKWTKDFKRTSYLGGSVRGDWNPAVTRDLTAETVIVRGDEVDKQLAMRDLAGYAGVAHIRTPDGSSLTCDIQIDESQSYDTKKVSYTLTIMAIDPGEPVGVTLEEWEAMHELE